MQLAAEHVEVVRRARAIGDLNVVLGGELQETFEASRGVFRPLALVAVRQQHDEARQAEPLALARDDELIDDDLRAVDEVAELRLPKHERLRLRQAVAILVAEHGFLGEHGVDDLETRLIGR